MDSSSNKEAMDNQQNPLPATISEAKGEKEVAEVNRADPVRPVNPDPEDTEIRFTPYALAKLKFMCHAVETEISGMGVCPNHPLVVEDIVIIKQEASTAFVKLDTDAFADFMMDYCDPDGEHKLKPNNCSRVWIHTHPSGCTQPSFTDEETFRDPSGFGGADWGVMLILARSGEFYARLRTTVGGFTTQHMMRVMMAWDYPFPASDHDTWLEEIRENVDQVSFVTQAYPVAQSRGVSSTSKPLLSESALNPHTKSSTGNRGYAYPHNNYDPFYRPSAYDQDDWSYDEDYYGYNGHYTREYGRDETVQRTPLEFPDPRGSSGSDRDSRICRHDGVSYVARPGSSKSSLRHKTELTVQFESPLYYASEEILLRLWQEALKAQDLDEPLLTALEDASITVHGVEDRTEVVEFIWKDATTDPPTPYIVTSEDLFGLNIVPVIDEHNTQIKVSLGIAETDLKEITADRDINDLGMLDAFGRPLEKVTVWGCQDGEYLLLSDDELEAIEAVVDGTCVWAEAWERVMERVRLDEDEEEAIVLPLDDTELDSIDDGEILSTLDGHQVATALTNLALSLENFREAGITVQTFEDMDIEMEEMVADARKHYSDDYATAMEILTKKFRECDYSLHLLAEDKDVSDLFSLDLTGTFPEAEPKHDKRDGDTTTVLTPDNVKRARSTSAYDPFRAYGGTKEVAKKVYDDMIGILSNALDAGESSGDIEAKIFEYVGESSVKGEDYYDFACALCEVIRSANFWLDTVITDAWVTAFFDNDELDDKVQKIEEGSGVSNIFEGVREFEGIEILHGMSTSLQQEVNEGSSVDEIDETLTNLVNGPFLAKGEKLHALACNLLHIIRDCGYCVSGLFSHSDVKTFVASCKNEVLTERAAIDDVAATNAALDKAERVGP